MKYTCTANDPA
uniref:Uncharacterized protein n=1 Tax=Musa acuminata subsp. malaccensis TaxID=214687 RepID=A0A804HVZ2_MUSAM